MFGGRRQLHDVGSGNGVDHCEPVDEVRHAPPVRRIGAAGNRGSHRREPVEAVREGETVGAGNRMRQHLADRRVGIGARRHEFADPIVQMQPAVVCAADRERCRDRLRGPIQLERRVGADRDVALDVLAAERSFPVDGVEADDRRGQSGNAGLYAERVKVVAEAREEEIVGGADVRGRPQRESDRERQQGPTHGHVQGTGEPPSYRLQTFMMNGS